MAENNELVSMAQAFTGLPMRDLIGGPLMAATEANNQMVMTQTKYILDTGFNRIALDEKDPEKGYRYEPIMVNLVLKRPVIIEPGPDKDGKPQPPIIETVTSEVDVPIISLMPIPTLGVDEVDISFDMEVKSSYGSTQSSSQANELAAKSSFEAKLGYGPFSVSVKGSVSYNQSSKSSSETTHTASNSASYHVQVHAAQQPVPKGLSLILEAYAKNIGPFTLPNDKDQPAQPQLAAA
jgi:hypothetical protein